MAKILSFEQWSERYTNSVSSEIRDSLMTLHGVNADSDIGTILQQEYDMYVANRKLAGDTP